MKRWLIRRLRSRWIWPVVVLFAVASPELYAWHHFRAARAAAEADRPAVARQHLRECRRVWPWNQRVDVRLASARVARQDGDLAAARDELRDARRLAGSTTPDLAFEWALIQATDGNVAEVAEYLQNRADADPALQRGVWEALAEGYLAVYRANDAFTIAARWESRFPGDLLALELRGRAAIQGRGLGLKLGAKDLQEVLRRDPDRVKTRTVLSLALLELALFSEAIPELERLSNEQPDQPDHRVRLARCLKMTDRSAEAIRLLDGVLAVHPDHGLALRTRGQFALSELRLGEALKWLRRAATELPNDYQTQYLYYQALLQSGQAPVAAEQLTRAEAAKRRGEQLAELRTRRLAERPLDPAVYTEMGSLLLQTGNPEQGLRWLEVALSLDPTFRPAHEALASHFEKIGDVERAAAHRKSGAGSK